MRIVASASALNEALPVLQSQHRFYIDTEFDSRASGKRLSLVQVAAGEEVLVIDVIALRSLAALAPALCRADACWVLHAGLQDVELLVAALGVGQPPALLDTQVAWAFTGPEFAVSLAYLQFKLLGIRAPKGFQADDWLRRPLPPEQLQYAASDVAHLPALEAALLERAERLGRRQWLEAVSREVLQPTPSPSPPLSLASFRNAWQLEGQSLAVLAALIEWYNGLSEVSQAQVDSRGLLQIAARRPHSKRELEALKGVPQRFAAEHGEAVLRLIARAEQSPPDRATLEPPAYARFEDLLLESQLNLLKIQVCADLSIAPELAFPRALTQLLLHHVGDSSRLAAGAELLHGWRGALLAEPWRMHATQLLRDGSRVGAAPP
jgi:ribonuclease D